MRSREIDDETHFPLPRVQRATIERGVVNAWLEATHTAPLRFVLAPTGAGKTSALVAYARAYPRPRYYVQLPAGDDVAIETACARALSLESYSYNALLAKLAEPPTCELILDGVEHVIDANNDLLSRLLNDVPESVTLLYAGTSTTLDIHRLTAIGLAQVLPRETLRMTAAEALNLAQEIGLSVEASSLADLLEATDGWAVVVADILRLAHEAKTTLTDAYERWIVTRGRSFSVYMHDELERMPSGAYRLFNQALTTQIMTPVELQRLEDSGAPIIVSGSAYRPYRVVIDLDVMGHAQRADANSLSDLDRIVIRMFGRFVVKLGDREVNWIRRRDQQIFRFVALRPDGIALKRDVLATFWPETDPHLAAQSLRTACSTIRKAIGAALGPEIAETLFATDGPGLRVDLTLGVVDIQRFKAHIAAGLGEDDEGNVDTAFAHYRAAEVLYRSELFSGEPDEPWFLPQREIYRAMIDTARERVSSILAELGEERFAENASHHLPASRENAI